MTNAEPTRDELLAMAYVDGELHGAERAAFETRLASEAALAREVTELRRFELAAHAVAPPDPLDAEWRRLRTDAVQRALRVSGALALLAGAYALVSALVLEAPCELASRWTLGAAAVICGAALYGAAILRERLRTRALDPYTAIER